MKRLSLLRHAKTEKPLVSQDDRDRSLLPKGIEDAKRLGNQLKRDGFAPEVIFCSTARRAEQTLECVLAEYPLKAVLTRVPPLYLASPEQLLKLVRDLPEDADSALLVGHNPGLPHFCWLAAENKTGEAQAIMMQFSPCSLAEILFPVESWEDARPDMAVVRRVWAAE